MEKDKIGVHVSHCCVIHGCKYGDEDCPVESGDFVQEYPCESCGADGITNIEELQAMITLGIHKCPTCGHYYKKD